MNQPREGNRSWRGGGPSPLPRVLLITPFDVSVCQTHILQVSCFLFFHLAYDLDSPNGKGYSWRLFEPWAPGVSLPLA
jgi:hypothetical protein